MPGHGNLESVPRLDDFRGVPDEEDVTIDHVVLLQEAMGNQPYTHTDGTKHVLSRNWQELLDEGELTHSDAQLLRGVALAERFPYVVFVGRGWQKRDLDEAQLLCALRGINPASVQMLDGWLSRPVIPHACVYEVVPIDHAWEPQWLDFIGLLIDKFVCSRCGAEASKDPADMELAAKLMTSSTTCVVDVYEQGKWVSDCFPVFHAMKVLHGDAWFDVYEAAFKQ